MSRLPVVGETFGRYVLQRQLGEGGMGIVYAALDTVLDRRVALKLVAPHLAQDAEFRSRFAREAATQARLDSAHVVRIYDYGEHDGVLYLSTQMVDGADLASLVADRGALDPAVAVEVTTHVLEGLEAAHEAGVVHRDVKPANVLIRRSAGGVTAYLCDFGIATMAGQALTRAGQVIGSLPWMAPERHYGEEPGPVGDLYSAGCLFFYALTGAAPYVGSDGEVILGHLEGEIPQLVGRSAFARRANHVLARSLAKDPAARYASAAEMAADLRALASVAPGEIRVGGAETTVVRAAVARPTTGPRRTVPLPPRRRAWLPVALTAVGALVLVAGGLGVKAVVDDDPALAAGATVTEVGGRTITVQPTRTLAPVDETEAPGSGAGSDLGAISLGEDGTAYDESSSGGSSGDSGTSSGGTGGTGTRTQAQEQVAPARPANKYRCWNGTEVVELSSCSYPTGYAGARWMVNNASCTYKANLNDSRVTDDRYGCKAPGATNTVYVERATSVAAARSFLLYRMPHPDVEWEWTYGRQMRLHGTGHWEFGRYWTGPDGAAWFVYIDAPTEPERNAAVDAFKNHCRPISEIRGVPL